MKVLKLPLAVQVLGVVLGWQSHSMECPSGLQHRVCAVFPGQWAHAGVLWQAQPQPACTRIPSPALSVEPFPVR